MGSIHNAKLIQKSKAIVSYANSNVDSYNEVSIVDVRSSQLPLETEEIDNAGSRHIKIYHMGKNKTVSGFVLRGELWNENVVLNTVMLRNRCQE